MDDYLKVANSAIVWVLCGITVAIALGQAILYMRMAKKTAAKVQMPSEIPNKAFRIGLISAISPALGVFIVMVGLMASIGGPMAWLRLSIIGAAATELTAASLGAPGLRCGAGRRGLHSDGHGRVLVRHGPQRCRLAGGHRRGDPRSGEVGAKR